MQVPKRKGDARLFAPSDYHLSPQKYRELEIKLASLIKRRPKEASEVKRLAEMGDFSENAAYQLAKGRLRGLNQRILDLEEKIKRAEIIVAEKDTDSIRIGHKVTLNYQGQKVSYLILGSQESNPSQGIISHLSPLGSSLIGKKIGDRVLVGNNGKQKEYLIEKISS